MADHLAPPARATTEKNRVDAAAAAIDASYEGAGDRLLRHAFDSIRPWLTGESCLELGPATGHETRLLRPLFAEIVAVDGSARFAKALADRYADDDGVTVVESLFETFSPGRTFDTVVAAHVLEHVEHPRDLLERCREWVGVDGRLVLQVPNALSFHRLAGTAMGMLSSPYELNDRDVTVGHRRVYDKDSLIAEVEACGFRVAEFRGSFAKFLSDGQMNSWFTDEMYAAYDAIGLQFQENSANISVLALPV